MQMNQWMNNHDSMFRMSSSWMNSNNGMGNFGKFGSNNMFSKGLNYGFGGDSSFDNGSNWKVSPPSGPRNNSSRPNFANRYSNYSGGMNSFNFKPGAMYDDGMCGSRFNNYSGNYFDSKPKALYDDGMCGYTPYSSFSQRF